VSQAMVIISILLMASTNPADGEAALVQMAVAAVLLGFSSATQDIVIDAYRIECAPPEWQGILSSLYVAGYRIGMIVAGAGALYLASYYGSQLDSYQYSAWSTTYSMMACVMLIGVIATCIAKEPESNREAQHERGLSENIKLLVLFLISVISFILFYREIGPLVTSIKASLSQFSNGAFDPVIAVFIAALRLLSSLGIALVIGGLIAKYLMQAEKTAHDTWILPVKDIFQRYGTSAAWLLLCLIGLYRISDIVLGVTSNLFYQDMGFSKTEIATTVKTYGVIITIVGSFIGGLFATRIGVMKTLLWGAILSSATNLLFVALSQLGPEINIYYSIISEKFQYYSSININMLFLVVSADNLAAGFATAAFIAFLSSLTNISFTAVQYAVFSSIMTLFPKMLGGYSGGIVESFGYSWFFIITTLLGLPVILLCLLASRRLD
jgi:PAT family beta-lactamase induction signal transducer AmpG